MLDSYNDSQPIIYKILNNSVKKNKMSHAYLFESNGDNGQAYEMALAFAKTLLCPYKYTNCSKCVNCTQCNKIDKNEFSELTIIEPDGLWIKKEQLDILQKKFETKAIESDKRVYIINYADKMNSSSANSILKFLEEPEPDIIAILIADNRYQLLDTIVSRCQIISFNNKSQNNSNNLLDTIRLLISNNKLVDINDENLQNYIDNIINFINYYEKHKLDSLLYVDKNFNNIFDTKELLLFAFDTMILYYKDVIKKACGINDLLFIHYDIQINDIIILNTVDSLLCKVNKLMDLKKNIYINANTNLLMDKLIIELSKGE